MILILGCGFLGSYLLREFAADPAEPVLAASRTVPAVCAGDPPNVRRVRCDLTDERAVRALAAQTDGAPLTVFYLAANHSVDAIFRDPQGAARVNLDGLERFLSAVPHIRSLFYASTDCVYGENTAAVPRFPESAPRLPVNEYGRQKAAAEDIVLAHGFCVLRYGFMLGPSLTGRPHFYDRLRESLLRGETVEMIDGMRRSVLHYRTAAALTAALARVPADLLPRTVNLCGDLGYTKYELGLSLAAALGAPASLIRPIGEDEGKKFFADARASSAVMENALLKKTLGLRGVRWTPEPDGKNDILK